MRLAFLLAAGTSLALGQTRVDPVKLLAEIAGVASATSTWRIDALMARGSAWQPPESIEFRFLQKSAFESRYEEKGGSSPLVVTCDGTYAWVYYPRLKVYSKTLASESSKCTLGTAGWHSLPALTRIDTDGGCDTRVPSPTGPYQRIRAWLAPPAGAGRGAIEFTFCVDPVRRLMLWEKGLRDGYMEIRSYVDVSHDAEQFNAGDFVFTPPPDARLFSGGLPVSFHLGTRLPLLADITPPHLVKKEEPHYTEAARQAKVQGSVVLFLAISAKGEPFDVLVLRGLDPGLDAEAVKTVRKWRFKPALKKGGAIEAVATVEVNFRLLTRQ